jgi:glycosyltransferase involved in cell wall biosynthesis
MTLDRRPTVMFLAPKLVVGGAETALQMILSRPDDLSFRPVVTCTYAAGPVGFALASIGIDVHQSLGRNRWDVRLIPRLIALMRRERVQVLYDVMSDNNSLIYGLLAAKVAGVAATVCAVHHSRPSRGKTQIIRGSLMKRYSRVAVLSERHREFVNRQYAVPIGKMHVVPNGIDLDRFSRQLGVSGGSVPSGLPPDHPLVAMVATLRPLKAHDVFLRAAALVSVDVPGASFVLVGEGPERERLEREAERLGMGEKVHFLGSRADVPEILSHVDVSVLSSHHETLSISILEAMAACRPVVATNVGLMSELVIDGETGFLVDRGDFRALASAIVRLLKDRTLAARLGAAGRERVETQFSVDNMIAGMDSIVAEALEGSSTLTATRRKVGHSPWPQGEPEADR